MLCTENEMGLEYSSYLVYSGEEQSLLHLTFGFYTDLKEEHDKLFINTTLHRNINNLEDDLQEQAIETCKDIKTHKKTLQSQLWFQLLTDYVDVLEKMRINLKKVRFEYFFTI